MKYRIDTVDDTLAAVEVDGRGHDLGTFEVRVPLNKNPISARDALEELLDLRDKAPIVASGVRDILEDVGFGRLSPNAITDGLLRQPEDLRATVEALHSIYPSVVGVSNYARTSLPGAKTGKTYAPFDFTANSFAFDDAWS